MGLSALLCIFILAEVLKAEDAKLDVSASEFYEKTFKKLYKQRRAEQIEAVKNLRKLTNEKQHSMINIMAEKIFALIQECRAYVEASGYIPGISEFPTDEKVRDSLSNILENTALFSEVVIRFPDITESILKTNNNWDVLLQWSIAFCNQVQYLLDKGTLKLLDLVSQELNHTERSPNYVNPYRKEMLKKAKDSESVTSQKKKKKTKQIKKGPRLITYNEL